MDGLLRGNERLSKEEELSEIEEEILEEHTIFSKKNHMKNVEDAVEGNDNNFDGIINNVEPDPLEKVKEEIKKKEDVKRDKQTMENIGAPER